MSLHLKVAGSGQDFCSTAIRIIRAGGLRDAYLLVAVCQGIAFSRYQILLLVPINFHDIHLSFIVKD
jgi:hypothetical protein